MVVALRGPDRLVAAAQYHTGFPAKSNIGKAILSLVIDDAA